MNSNNTNILLLLVYLVFGAIIFLFFFEAIKTLFDTENVLIKAGRKDKEVLKEGARIKRKKVSKTSLIITNVIGIGILVTCVGLILIKNLTNPLNLFDTIPVAIVSGSMDANEETKTYTNPYLNENHLDNQFSTGSIIILHKLPEKNGLKMFDVVAYKNKDKVTVVHRIIGFGYYDNDTFVMTDNVNNATEFIFRGDNNTINDTSYVHYSDMIGIYKNEKVSYLGYVVEFAQSFFGLFTFAALISMIEAYEIFNKKRSEAVLKRYKVIAGNYDIKHAKANKYYDEDIIHQDDDIDINDEKIDDEDINDIEDNENESTAIKALDYNKEDDSDENLDEIEE